jgi:glutathione peroxidase
MTATEKSLHDFTLQGIDGMPMPLSQFKGKVVLLVNTASECSYTVQYEALEELWQANKDKGLVVVGVPANDFGAQEPGTAGEIASFCKINYGVTFPLTNKMVVKGDGGHPLYQWAVEKAGKAGRPKWNFHKFLFDRNGRFIDWFSSRNLPKGPKLTAAVKKALAT